MPQTPATPSNSSSFDDDLKSVQSFEQDLAEAQKHVDQGQSVPHPVVQRLLSWLPAAGGALGGMVGGVLGAPEGGVGAIPGAIGGAMVGGAAGRSLENAANVYLGNKAPTSAAEAFGSSGRAGLTQGANEAAGGVLGATMNRVGPALVQSAVKPGLKYTLNAVKRGVSQEDLPIVKTLLKEGVNVSRPGIDRLDRIIGATNEEIKAAIKDLPPTIDPARVAQRTESVMQRVSNQVDPDADVAAVKGVTERFMNNPRMTVVAQTGTKQVPTGVLDASGQMTTRAEPVMGRVPKMVTPAEAQSMKQGTYQALKEKAYGELKGPEIEAQKALARGLKEDIADEAAKRGVDLNALNAREGAAIVTKEAIAKRLALAGNRDPASLAWLAHNPVTAMAFILERSPVVKSYLGRGMYTQAARFARVTPDVMRTMLTAIGTGEE